MAAMTFAFESVSPEMAKAWLSNQHPHQRATPLGAGSKAQQYAKLMAEGGWDPRVPQGIFLTEEGQLLNGGNRLNAVVLADTSVTFLIVRNVPVEIFDVIDTGKARFPGQFIGGSSGPAVASAARWLMWYEQRFDAKPSGSAMSFPLRAVVRFVEQQGDTIARAVEQANACNKGRGAPRVPVAIHAAVLLLAPRAGINDGEIISDWLVGIRTGANLTPDDPRLVLRDRYMKRIGKRNAGMVAEDWWAIVSAFNAYVAGEGLYRLTRRGTYVWPRVGESGRDYERRLDQASHAARRRRDPAKSTRVADAAVVREIIYTTGTTLPEAMAASGRTDHA